MINHPAASRHPSAEGNLDRDGAVGIGAFLSWGIEIFARCTISIFDTKIVRALARFFYLQLQKNPIIAIRNAN